MSECVVYLPEYDQIFIMIEYPADPIEIGFKGEWSCDFLAEYSKHFTNIDSVVYGTRVEFIGFL